MGKAAGFDFLPPNFNYKSCVFDKFQPPFFLFRITTYRIQYQCCFGYCLNSRNSSLISLPKNPAINPLITGIHNSLFVGISLPQVVLHKHQLVPYFFPKIHRPPLRLGLGVATARVSSCCCMRLGLLT
jgi:hypothetical protein